MTIVTLVSGCGNAYPGDGTRDGGGQGGRWVSSTPTAGGRRHGPERHPWVGCGVDGTDGCYGHEDG
jgi:hypothetical protein